MTILVILGIIGCAGKTAHIDTSNLGFLKKDYGIRHEGRITFSVSPEGQAVYSGHPSCLTFCLYSVSVDLKAIQEACARNILDSIYEDVIDAGRKSQLISYISDFKYKWPFSFSTRAIVSFKLHLHAFKDGKAIYSKVLNIDEHEGSEGKTFMAGALFGLAGDYLSGDTDKRSQMVANATLEAVYKAYENEMIQIVRILDQKTQGKDGSTEKIR